MSRANTELKDREEKTLLLLINVIVILLPWWQSTRPWKLYFMPPKLYSVLISFYESPVRMGPIKDFVTVCDWKTLFIIGIIVNILPWITCKSCLGHWRAFPYWPLDLFLIVQACQRGTQTSSTGCVEILRIPNKRKMRLPPFIYLFIFVAGL